MVTIGGWWGPGRRDPESTARQPARPPLPAPAPASGSCRPGPPEAALVGGPIHTGSAGLPSGRLRVHTRAPGKPLPGGVSPRGSPSLPRAVARLRVSSRQHVPSEMILWYN